MATAIKTYKFEESLAFLIFVLLLTYIILAVYQISSDYYLGILLGFTFGLIVLTVINRIILNNDLRILQRLFADSRRAKKLRLSEKFISKDIRDFGLKLEESLVFRQKKVEELIEQSYSTNVLLNNMREGIVVLDLEMNILLLNRASLNLLKVDPDSRINTLQKIIRNNSLIEAVKNAINNGVGFELLVSKYLSLNKSFLFRGSILRDADENLMGILILIQDISELEKLQNMRKDFVANVSHELRTPITAIKGYVETMLATDNTVLDQVTASKFLGIIQKHVTRLEDLVEDILKLSRIEKQEEQGILEVQKFNIKNFCQEIIERSETQARLKNIEFVINDFEQEQVITNRELLDQAFSNLISNAIKYSPSDAAIKIDQKIENDLLKLSVSDQGPGIEEAYHERIFERFYRVDFGRTRDVGGTGLGLAIVKHAMSVIGGSVNLKTELGKGCCFTLTIPNQILTIEK